MLRSASQSGDAHVHAHTHPHTRTHTRLALGASRSQALGTGPGWELRVGGHTEDSLGLQGLCGDVSRGQTLKDQAGRSASQGGGQAAGRWPEAGPR